MICSHGHKCCDISDGDSHRHKSPPEECRYCNGAPVDPITGGTPAVVMPCIGDRLYTKYSCYDQRLDLTLEVVRIEEGRFEVKVIDCQVSATDAST